MTKSMFVAYSVAPTPGSSAKTGHWIGKQTHRGTYLDFIENVYRRLEEIHGRGLIVITSVTKLD